MFQKKCISIKFDTKKSTSLLVEVSGIAFIPTCQGHRSARYFVKIGERTRRVERQSMTQHDIWVSPCRPSPAARHK